MEKRWVLKPQGNKDLVRHLSKVLNINENLANLLAQRGLPVMTRRKLISAHNWNICMILS